ncbi:methionine/alanine import family NSS transporter small subunit [Nesterenkonia sp. F]|nr:methionine/alanine import family NSS transporter small subunit [Nesterenkonia sp. F]
METSAIVLMLIALVLVWGGLIAAVVHLSRNPDPE